MRIPNIMLAIAATTLLAAGCAQQKAPATKALDQIEASLKDVKDDAAKYAPDGLKGVESQYDRLKESLDKKEYENVLAGTPQLQKAVDSLKDAVNSGKEQAATATKIAKTEWANLKDEVPKMVDTIQARVDTLNKSKRLPFGISKDEFEGSKSVLESMKSTWAEATKDYKAGNEIEAASKAKTVQGMGAEVIEKLKIKKV
ncbi:MAG: hypothetical protein ABI821_16105 [Pseudomonadota bacterium]